jgi:hypothetical protein
MEALLPAWALLGLCFAALTTGVMLALEKYRLDGFAFAFWHKVACALGLLPFVFRYGLPADAGFYVLTALTAILYIVSDVVMFRAIPAIGAGPVSRITPASVIFGFMLWFAVDPVSFGDYLQQPLIAALIFLVLCLWVWFATHLRKCPVSMAAARAVWFTVFANVVGPVLTKKVVDAAGIPYGIYAFPFVQALMMLAFLWIFFRVKKRLKPPDLFAPRVWRIGLALGAVNSLAVVPAYTTALGFLNVFFILIAYKVMGRKNDGNVTAGLGMVACAAVLIILKSRT